MPKRFASVNAAAKIVSLANDDEENKPPANCQNAAPDTVLLGDENRDAASNAMPQQFNENKLDHHTPSSAINLTADSPTNPDKVTKKRKRGAFFALSKEAS